MFLIANDAQPNQWGNSPSYGIFHGGTAPQLLPDNHPLLKYVLPAECSCPCSCRHSPGLPLSLGSGSSVPMTAPFWVRCCWALLPAMATAAGMLPRAIDIDLPAPAAGAPPGASVCPWLPACCPVQTGCLLRCAKPAFTPGGLMPPARADNIAVTVRKENER